ncbi:MAG: hypothetical protein WCF67_21630, partial [Chitinophagaceae bacterium]
MLLIILSWIYIAFIIFSFGLFCMLLIRKTVQSQLRLHHVFAETPNASLLLLAGLVTTAVIASLMSLFMPLAGLANLILLLLAIAIAFIYRRKAAYWLSDYWNALKSTHWVLILLFTGFVFILAYLSELFPSHHDYGLYYGTTMQWIE